MSNLCGFEPGSDKLRLSVSLRVERACLAFGICLAIATVQCPASTSFYVDAARSSNGNGSAGSPWNLWSIINWTTVTNAQASGDVTIYFSSRAIFTSVGANAVVSYGNNGHWLNLVGDEQYNFAASGLASWQPESGTTNRAKFTGGVDISIASGQSFIKCKGLYVDHSTWGCFLIGVSPPTLNTHDIAVINCVADTPAHNHGIWFGYAETNCYNITVSGNIVSNTLSEGIYMGHYNYLSDTITNVLVQSNLLVNTGLGVTNASGQGEIDIKPGCYGAIVRYNTLYRTAFGLGGSTCGTVVAADACQVYGNIFYHAQTESDGGWGSGIFINSEGDGAGTGKAITSCLVYNNLLYINGRSGIRLVATTSTPGADTSGVKIWNNTISSNALCGIEASVSSPRIITIAEFYNNIVSGNQTDMLLTAGATITKANNNLYWNGGTELIYGGATMTFAQWQALGFDAQGTNVNPSFASSGTFTLASGSPAIGTATNLSGRFTVDLTHKSRGSTWDMGVFQRSQPPIRVFEVH